MAEVVVKDRIRASADSVWELVSDFGGIAKWSSAIQSCEVTGSGVGAVRKLGVGAGAPIRERLESLDGGTRTLSYSIVDGPLPVESYLATMRVLDRGADLCEIEWRSTFHPKGLAEAQVAGILRGVYEGGIAALKKKLEK